MSKISDFFRDLWINITGVFAKFMRIAIPKTLKFFIARLSKFAMEVVRGLENVDLDNDAKREKAFGEIKAMAIKEGLYYENNWVHILITLALSAVRETVK